MQVAHHNDHITHAVIGGAKTIDFGISNSAEFFNILSSTLYKDQILAVVREVLCNAWDAHIEAGKTHIPVEITLDQEKFSIKDFGTGIHRDDMGLIYGTYGNSTKKNDGNQTGGFGLGCKAPFAYIDHFEVISCHDGVRTIYNLSKSSAQAMGKPGIVPIATFPTQDTGLQVTISLKQPADRARFITLINRIARNGDMNMTLNGNPIDRLGFDAGKSNYMLTSKSDVLDVQSEIMVRYGNVIYPVDCVGELQTMYQKIKSHLATLKGNYQSYRLIFQAPPHSISVTPSRESLSMQEHTLKTMNGLFTGFMDMVKSKLPGACEKFAEEVIADTVEEAEVAKLLSREKCLPGVIKGEYQPVQIDDLHNMARRYMQTNYPSRVEFRKYDISRRLKLMATAGLLDRGIAQTFLRTMNNITDPNMDNGGWLQRQIVAPLMTKMLAAGMDHERLYIYDGEDLNVTDAVRYRNAQPLVPAKQACPRSLFHTLPYLRNIVVLSTSRLDVFARARNKKAFYELGAYAGFMFYHVGMKKVDRENAIAFFKASGMEMVDLTEDVAPRSMYASTPRPAPKKGLVVLSSLKQSNSCYINTRNSRETDAPRIDNPEFVIQIAFRKDPETDVLDRWGDDAASAIVQLFGDKGGITTNSLMHAKYIKAGAKDFNDYVIEKLCHQMTTNPRIQQYWAYRPHRVNSKLSDLLYVVYENESMRKQFKIVNKLTQEDKYYLTMWEDYMKNRHQRNWAPAITKAHDHLEAIPVHPANYDLVEKFTSNKLVKLIDIDEMKNLFKLKDPSLTKKTIAVLTVLLNN